MPISIPAANAVRDSAYASRAESDAKANNLPSILFVDDETKVLAGLKNLLRRHRHQLDMAFASSVESAIEHLASYRCDILITDVRMPKADGLALLTHVRRQWPAIARVILSGHTGEEAKLLCSPLAHQFLMKPCAPETLVATILRILKVQQLLPDSSIRAALGTFSAIPPSPATVQMMRHGQHRTKVRNEDLAQACLHDVPLLARVLRIAGLHHFDAMQPRQAVLENLHSLGSEPLGRVLESIDTDNAEAVERYPWFSWEAETRHAFLVARLAQRFLEPVTPDLAQVAALCGLVHDFGRLAMLFLYPNTLRRAQAASPTNFDTCIDSEAALFGLDHARVAAYMLGLWGYPETIVQAVADHHSEPQLIGDTRRKPTIADALYIADYLVRHADATCPDVEVADVGQIREILSRLDHPMSWKQLSLLSKILVSQSNHE